MPRGDGTGPMGRGPMTGCAAGFCAGFNLPGYMNQITDRGFGMGFRCGLGCGLGWRKRYNAAGMTGWQQAAVVMPQMSRKQEIEILKNQANSLQNTLDAVNKQIQKIEDDNKN